MTKSQVIQEIANRLNDPTQTAFGDRIWSYFIESVYEQNPKLTATETINQSTSERGSALTDVLGVAKPTPTSQSRWNEIYAVNVNEIPAKGIDKDDYRMMLGNSLYFPAPGEAFFYFDGNQLIILTGYLTTTISYEIVYLNDPHTLLADLDDNDELTITNSLVYKVMPITVAKLKDEIGMRI